MINVIIHTLILMDDAVIMATSRDILMKRFDALVELCAIRDGDKWYRRRKHTYNYETKVKHTEKYVYLGSPVSESRSMRKDLELHTNTKHLNKFKLFCKK